MTKCSVLANILRIMTNKTRCAWVNLSNPLYVTYHDKEWGTPLHDDQAHFELLTLEGAQAGLSWETVLNKRAHYRKVFCAFDPNRVARITANKIGKLLEDPGIIRNRLKVESTITNAKAFIKIQQEYGSFDNYIWEYVQHKPIVNCLHSLQDHPTSTELSNKISKDLKARGFRFVGTTIIYAYLQAAGLVNDHIIDCYKSWQVYMVRCNDGSLYTGISNDVARRVAEHNAQTSKSAKYLRGKTPCHLVYQEHAGDKSQASKRELAIKRLSKEAKEQIIAQNQHAN